MVVKKLFTYIGNCIIVYKVKRALKGMNKGKPGREDSLTIVF